MNQTTKHILGGFIVGSGIGYLVGVILADQLYPEYYTDEELAAYKEKLKIYTDNNEIRPMTKETRGDNKNRKVKVSTDYARIYGEKADIDKLINDGSSNEPPVPDYSWEDVDDTVTFENIGELGEDYWKEMRDDMVPHVITEDEYLLNEPSYKQVPLSYHGPDDVLTDVKGSPVPSSTKLVGDYALVNFGAFAEDDHIVYVRNPVFEVDYMVQLIDMSYEESAGLSRPLRKTKVKPTEGEDA